MYMFIFIYLLNKMDSKTTLQKGYIS